MSESIGYPLVVAAHQDNGDDLASAISRSARMLISHQCDGAAIVGFATVALYEDGGYSIGFRMPEDHAFLRPTLFCAMLKEIIQRDMTGRLSVDDYAMRYFS